jgi:ABC-2 type transport system permease protein
MPWPKGFAAMTAVDYAARKPGERTIGRINRIGLWTLYLKEVRRFWKVWLQTVAAPMVTTVLFMAIFSFALGGSGRTPAGVSYETFIAPGLLMMTILQNAFQNPSSSILISKVQGNIVDVLMPPLSPLELTVGYVAGGITRGLVVGLAVLAAFLAWPGLHIEVVHPWAFVYFAVAGSALMAVFGAVIGIWAEKFDHAAGINNFVIIPLTLLSGTFYSIERLPPSVAEISRFNPFFYLIDGFRYSMIGRADGDVAVGVVMTLVLTTALGFWVFYLFKSGYKLKP